MSPQTPQTAAPRTRDPQRRRRELLDAAAEIVVERGPAALTHRAAASRSGVALGSATRYFPTVDALREATLQMLSDESDAQLDEIERELAECDDPAARCAELMHGFLLDSRQVHATVAMTCAATTDPSLRSIALRWDERLTQILSGYVSAEAATVAQLFLDGATLHAALHDAPLERGALERAIRAVFAMPIGVES